jgi:hypothetical protein
MWCVWLHIYVFGFIYPLLIHVYIVLNL